MTDPSPTRWYSPGTWLVIAGPLCVVALDATPDLPLYEAWGRATTHGADLDELLRIAVEQGLSGLPSFAIVQQRDDDVRLVLRGAARAWCADDRTLDAGGAAPWRDGAIASTALPIRIGEPSATSTPFRLPLSSGVAFASTVDLYAAPVAAAPVAPTHGWDAPIEATPVPSSIAAPTPVDSPTPLPADTPPVTTPAVTTSVAADFAHLFEPTVNPRPSIPPAPAVSPDDTLFTRPEIVEPPAPVSPVAEMPLHVPTPPPPAPALSPGLPVAAASPGGLIDAFPWAAEEPNAPAPARPPETGVDTPSPHTPAPLIDAAPAAPPLSGWTPEPTPPPFAPPVDPVVAVPRPVTPSPSSWSSSLAEYDDHTVARSVLPNAVVGPTVLAAHCPSGHLVPVHGQYCRVCDLPITPNQSPLTIPRPTLGLLRLPGGESIPLDRGVLLGRSPAAREVPFGEQQHVVSLASPEKDISRNHLEIRLDGWHVLAIDLGSVNGTVVVLPGRQPQRLRPEEPVILERGATVTLADEVTLVFEVTA